MVVPIKKTNKRDFRRAYTFLKKDDKEINAELITDFNGKQITFKKPNADRLPVPFYQKSHMQEKVEEKPLKIPKKKKSPRDWDDRSFMSPSKMTDIRLADADP